MSVKTKTVSDRRVLCFRTLEDLRNEAKSLANDPNHRMLGNWSLGQVFSHLAILMNLSMDGFSFSAPLVPRLILTLMRNRILSKGIPPGASLKGQMSQLIPPPTSTQEGLEQLCQAIDRLENEPTRHPSPLLGKLTRAQWDHLHCRHGELHLSFAMPEGKDT